MEEKPAYRIDELGKSGPVKRTKLYEAIRTGELRARKAGRATIVLREDYLAFLSQLPVKQARQA